MTAAQRAMTELGTWPHLVSGPPRCSVGHAFGAEGHELVHFHADDCADLYLTSTAVERLLPQLRHSSAIRVQPGASWITVLLECDTDVELLLSLVSLALKEHDAHAYPSGPCDWERPQAC
ncbi:luciferase domain-containing protein [Streptomyces sp. SGAir0957]